MSAPIGATCSRGRSRRCATPASGVRRPRRRCRDRRDEREGAGGAVVSLPRLRRAYADAAHGQMHYAECSATSGAGALPIVLLHQTPRSWREYGEVLPLLGARRRTIAVDTAGFGESDDV